MMRFALSIMLIHTFISITGCTNSKKLVDLPELGTKIDDFELVELDSVQKEIFWRLKTGISKSELKIGYIQPSNGYKEIELIFYKEKVVAINALTDDYNQETDKLLENAEYLTDTEAEILYLLYSKHPKLEIWKYVKSGKVYVLKYGNRFRRITTRIDNPL